MKTSGILNIIGGIITLVAGLLVVAVGAVIGSMLPFFGGVFTAFGALMGVWGIIVGLVMIVAAVKGANKTWTTLGLVFSILGLITVQGWIIGPILGLVGSALAWKQK